FGLPSGVRGIAVGGTFVHCAKAGEHIRIMIARESRVFMWASCAQMSSSRCRDAVCPTIFRVFEPPGNIIARDAAPVRGRRGLRLSKPRSRTGGALRDRCGLA